MKKDSIAFRAGTLLLAAVMALCILPAVTPNAEAIYDNTWVNTGNLRDDIVGVALTQSGYLENGLNNNKFGASFGTNNQAWCAVFVWWCCLKAGVPKLPMTASSTALRDGFVKNGYEWHSVESGYAPRKGDIVFFTVPFDTGLGHTGIIRSDSPARGPIHTVEGNTTNPNGRTLDGVFEKDRPLVGSDMSVAGYISLTDVPATDSHPADEVLLPEDELPETDIEKLEAEEAVEKTDAEVAEEVTEEKEENAAEKTATEETAVEEKPAEETAVEETPVEQATAEESKAEPLKTGWALEDGRWHYYDMNGALLTDDWAPVSYGWRRLDMDGELDETMWADENMLIHYVKAL